MTKARVGFFVTCLVDAMRPSIGFASLKLLEQAGCEVIFPGRQTCCGQPAFNSGADTESRKIAEQVIEAFEDCDYLVSPSGSCLGMIKVHFADLFAEDLVALVVDGDGPDPRRFERRGAGAVL